MKKNIIGLAAISLVVGAASLGTSVASAQWGWDDEGTTVVVRTDDNGFGNCGWGGGWNGCGGGWNRCGFNRCGGWNRCGMNRCGLNRCGFGGGWGMGWDNDWF